MKILSFILKLFSAPAKKKNSSHPDYHTSASDGKRHYLDTSNERPVVNEKNKWLYPAEGFIGKKEAED